MSTTAFAKPDTYSVFSGKTVTVSAAKGLLANDYTTRSGSSALVATSFSSPSHGSLSVSLDGSLTYVPDAGFVGTDTFTYYISDGAQTSSAIATIDVVQPSLIAAPDTFAMDANGTLTLDAAQGLLANDLSTGGTLVATSFSSASHGSLSVSLDGSVTYVPDPGFVGTDTFTYYISNGYSTASAIATIDVVDGSPVANKDVYTARAGQTLTIDAAQGLLANDIDPGGTVVATSFSSAAHGSLSVSLDGSLTYVPDAGFTGTDTFTYYISDGAQTASAVATIDVVDQAPVAAANFYRVGENSTLTVGAAAGLLANDFDPDGDPIVATSFSSANHGSLSVSLDGSLTYTPAANYVGTDSFTYYISDGALTSSAVVTLEVGQTATIANPDTFHDDAGTTLTLDAADGLLANDYPETGHRTNTLVATSFSSPSHGSLSVSLDGSLTYVPNAGFVGTDTFTYYISDGTQTSSAIATIDVVEPTLVAAPDTFVTHASDTLTLDAAQGLLANDLSTGGTLVATSFSSASHGSLSVSLDGSVTYVPDPGFVGTDTFTYYISNGYSTASATASINVVDAPPVANKDVYTVRAGQTLTVDAAQGLLANDIDPGGTVVATSFSSAAHGSLSVSLDGSLTYVPDAGFTGTDTFTYYISDGAQTAFAVDTIDVVDQAPIAAADYYHVGKNATLTVGAASGLLANDFDPDGDPIVATSFSSASHGSLSVSLDGSLTYTPAANYLGTDSFTYYISDGALTASTTAYIDVVACFVRGTLIQTAHGERPVEELTIGDLVMTSAGRITPIRWVGRRSYGLRFVAANPHLQPVRIRAGALGRGLPRRDLLVSAQHAMLLDDYLVPALYLVDGQGIVRERTAMPIDYVHIELDRHDTILAEGAASETFLDDNSRGIFHNASEHAVLYPEDAVDGRFCAPRLESGYVLEAIRLRLTRDWMPSCQQAQSLG